jgi:hypothetical protein
MESHSPPEALAFAWQARTGMGPDDLPVGHAAERERAAQSKETAADVSKRMAAAFMLMNEAKPRTITGTTTTPDGRDEPCEYAIVNRDSSRRWHEARTRAHVEHAGWLVQRARTSLPASQPRSAPRARGAGRPAARRRRTSTTRDDGAGSDSDGPGKAGPHDSEPVVA